MQSRHDKSCWQLFVSALPSFTKMIAIGMLLLDQKALAAESTKFRFFSHDRDIPPMSLDNPCIQSYPGTHLLVTPPLTNNQYVISQHKSFATMSEHRREDNIDLEKQLLGRRFVGDFFSNGKLQTLKDSRFQALKDKTFANSDYTVDLSNPDFIEIEILKPRK